MPRTFVSKLRINPIRMNNHQRTIGLAWHEPLLDYSRRIKIDRGQLGENSIEVSTPTSNRQRRKIGSDYPQAAFHPHA